MVLHWTKDGVRGAFVGIRSTTTGELREPTPDEVERFKREFRGSTYPKPPPDDFFEVVFAR